MKSFDVREASNDDGVLPLVSIVVPTMNQADFLFETLSSIVQQDYPRIELIVVDGGSTDNSREIIEQFRDRIYYWHSKPDEGQVDAVAQGLKISNGVLVTYINSDDILLPGSVSEVVRAWGKNPEAVVFGNYFIIDAQSRVREKKIAPAHVRWISWELGPIMCQPGTFFTKRLYEKVGGVDIQLQYAFDRDLFLRFMQSGARFIKTRKFLSAFRRHAEQKGASAYWHQICSRDAETIERRYASYRASKFVRRAARLCYFAIQIMSFGYLYTFGYRVFKERRFKRYF